MMVGAIRSARSVIACLMAVALLLLTGCGGPPKKLDKAAEQLTGQIKQTRSDVDKAKAEFDKKLNQGTYAFIKDYAPAEQHADRFDQAKAKLDEADKVYTSKVKAVADKYNDKRKGELEAGIAEVNKLNVAALALAAEPTQWVDKVAATKADPNKVLTDSASAMSGIKTTHDGLNKDVGEAKKLYDRNAANIDKKFQPISNQHAVAVTANDLLQAEGKKDSPNYAVMTTHATTVQNTKATFSKEAPVFQNQLSTLGDRETHTLLDIKVDTTVEISRTSWDESSDWNTDSDYDYPPVLVDMETAEYFAQFPADKVIATYNPGGFGDDFRTEKGVDRGRWDKLGIDPNKDWPGGGDNSSEFYVGELEDTYCHKLRVFRNGKTDASQRPNVADNPCAKYDTQSDLAQGVYWDEGDELHADAIGMDIYSKGVGDFADQATEEAAPPGIAYVGDPTTGQWKTDSSGNSFWDFYGPYLLFSQLIGGPNPYYYRNEYSTWNRDHRYSGTPYYSSVGNNPRFGSKSPGTASRFPGSAYVKSGLHNATVRNAGPVARSGGPGNGGK